jgi:F-type H+-transporting ATPase subunit a
MPDIEINLAPQVIAQWGSIPITNAFMAAVMTSIILIIVAIVVRRGAGIMPTKPQVLFESLIEFMLDKMVIAYGSEARARKFFPLIFTIFLFLLVANQFSLIPFIQSVVTPDGVELFRVPTSHYSLPIALTLMIIIMANVIAFTMHPLRHIGNFINFKGFLKVKKASDIPMAFLDLFLGLMDIIGEMAKIVSLATRLFGNIFAGEVIFSIITGLMVYTQFIVPIPFLVLSILSGLVQAFVFAMLSSIFMGLSLSGVSDEN